MSKTTSFHYRKTRAVSKYLQHLSALDGNFYRLAEQTTTFGESTSMKQLEIKSKVLDRTIRFHLLSSGAVIGFGTPTEGGPFIGAGGEIGFVPRRPLRATYKNFEATCRRWYRCYIKVQRERWRLK
jgi:hypothetical protein